MRDGHGLAPYATHPGQTRGRLHDEPPSPSRSVFQRDRDRIIHSAAFRRLQYKTQVFVYHEGDHYRTRLTHSIEVSQIARSICRQLGLNEDLAEALALAHDLGHTPFGHAGEEALDKAAATFGGFDHNAQTLRILTRLESRYADFDGLNLSWETLEGVVKHNGPLLKDGVGLADLPVALRDYAKVHDLELATFAGPEAQVAALSDDIAYDNHDVDDGLRAGLFSIDDLREVPLAAQALDEVERDCGALAPHQQVHEMFRRMMTRLIEDVMSESRRRLAEVGASSVDEIRNLGQPVITFSPEMAERERELKKFLFARMYRHWRVNRMTLKARRIVTDLFETFLNEPSVLPPEWAERTDGPGGARTARRAADFIAGMTDRFALEEHHRLFDPAMRT